MLNPKALKCYPQAIPALAAPVTAVKIFKMLRLLKKGIGFYSLHTKTYLTLQARTGCPKADTLEQISNNLNRIVIFLVG